MSSTDITFESLREVASLAPLDEGRARDKLLELAESGKPDAALQPVFDSLLFRLGLFPYTGDPDGLSFGERIVFEAHRPDHLTEVVLHAEQGQIYGMLMEGENVALSAPTSFGKSLIVDAIIASRRHKVIVIVIPTIALMEETRRRLAKFRRDYQIITSALQERSSDRVVYVLTPERVLDREDLKDTTFFVIDEFYKMSGNEEKEEHRQLILNRAFERLRQTKAQFYLLGPGISGITEGTHEKLAFRFVRTNFNTVVTRRHNVRVSQDERHAELARLVQHLEGPTLVFCKSPASTIEVMQALTQAGLPRSPDPVVASCADWLAENTHPEWTAVEAVRHGIGLHHGALQRSVANAMVHMFNELRLKVLVCTSTLIEGVNTSARNVVVFDNKIARSRIDYFTFNNIIGRAGRMFKHYVGHAYIFDEAPDDELPVVDLPMGDPDEDTPVDLLLEIGPDRLNPEALQALDAVAESSPLDKAQLRGNPWLRPQEQATLANFLRENTDWVNHAMDWDRSPRYEHLKLIMELMWDHVLIRPGNQIHNVRSGSQLAFILNQVIHANNIPSLIQDIIQNDRYVESVDQAVNRALSNIRNVAGYNGPRLLRGFAKVLSQIHPQYDDKGQRLNFYAARVEHGGLPAEINALEEYGIPIQLAQRLQRFIHVPDDLDATLHQLAAIPRGLLPFTPFEEYLLKDFRENAPSKPVGRGQG